MILVGEPERLESPDGAKSYKGEEIPQRIAQAERVLEAGFAEAAFVLAWSATEAALRGMIEEEGVSVKRITTSEYVLKLAINHGAISRDDYKHLAGMMEYSNAIAHGFSVDELGADLVIDLIRTTRHFLGSDSSKSQSQQDSGAMVLSSESHCPCRLPVQPIGTTST